MAGTATPAPGAGAAPTPEPAAAPDLDVLLDRMRTIRDRLAARLPGLPDDEELRAPPRPEPADPRRPA